VLIVPARVQGDGAAQEIVSGIWLAHQLSPPPDVLVVGRGGGSLEDLWAFNEELVVRAIASSKIPTVSAVGHEIDVTLSDLAADVRALTPSEAAERVVPAADEVLHRIRGYHERLRAAVERRLIVVRTKIAAFVGQRIFRRPFDLIHDRGRRLDELLLRTATAAKALVRERQTRLGTLTGKLESLSPLAVLQRGYTVTTDEKGRVIHDAEHLRIGKPLVTRFAKGSATSTVESINK
jgi:exodeoxyribonuclease VII large subunit